MIYLIFVFIFPTVRGVGIWRRGEKDMKIQIKWQLIVTLPGGNLLSSKPMKKHKTEIGNRNHKKLDKAGVKSHQMQTILPSIIYIYNSFGKVEPRDSQTCNICHSS